MSGKSFPHVRRTTTLPREPRRKTLTTPSRRSAINTGEVDSIQELKARAALRIEQVVEELRMARGLRHGERGSLPLLDPIVPVGPHAVGTHVEDVEALDRPSKPTTPRFSGAPIRAHRTRYARRCTKRRRIRRGTGSGGDHAWPRGRLRA